MYSADDAVQQGQSLISDAIKINASQEARSIVSQSESTKKVKFCTEKNVVSITNGNCSDSDHSSTADKYETVKITFVKNCRTVFVRPSEGKDNISYLSTISSCRRYADDAKPLDDVPTVNSIVLAPFDGEFSRAQVIEILPKRVAKVDFIDYGNIERVPFNDLKSLDRSMQLRKRIPYEITLAGIDENAMSNESGIKYLSELSDTLVSLLKIKSEDEENEYCLLDERTGESINRKLAKLLD